MAKFQAFACGNASRCFGIGWQIVFLAGGLSNLKSCHTKGSTLCVLRTFLPLIGLKISLDLASYQRPSTHGHKSLTANQSF